MRGKETDHVISGPMRGLTKNCIWWGKQSNRQTDGHGDSMTDQVSERKQILQDQKRERERAPVSSRSLPLSRSRARTPPRECWAWAPAPRSCPPEPRPSSSSAASGADLAGAGLSAISTVELPDTPKLSSVATVSEAAAGLSSMRIVCESRCFKLEHMLSKSSNKGFLVRWWKPWSRTDGPECLGEQRIELWRAVKLQSKTILSSKCQQIFKVLVFRLLQGWDYIYNFVRKTTNFLYWHWQGYQCSLPPGWGWCRRRC